MELLCTGLPNESDVLEKREVGHVGYIKHGLPAGQASREAQTK